MKLQGLIFKLRSSTNEDSIVQACAIGIWRLVILWSLAPGCWNFDNAWAQNVIDDRASGPIAPSIQITDRQALDLVAAAPPPVVSATKIRNSETERIARKLDRHVNEFLDGAPWMPFHHTLGISGYETYFNHPDEMFYALSIALPFLPPQTASRTKAFLAKQLADIPPYSVDGLDGKAGRAREAYEVPMSLRTSQRAKAHSAFGVYAFWSYVNATAGEATSKHWAAIKQRVRPLLESDSSFEITTRNNRRDEAEVLNGNLAAMIGTVRLARTTGDSAIERQALSRARQLLELRVNLERVNPKILEATESSTKHLHISKLARYCDLTPEIGEAIRTLTVGCGAMRLKTFREARNGWYLAFGDRMVGGENYTNPPHFSRALFAGVVFIEQLPPEQITSFVDVPWCKGDFYFIEKCALALSVAP
jgi:hypothetical protein